MGYRAPSLLSPAAALGGLTYTPAKVTGGAAAGASAGSLASTLTGTVSYSVLSGALVVNASTGALTTTGTAPSSGSIAARVIADNGTNIVGLTIGVPVQAAAVPAAPPAPSTYASSGPSVSGSGAQPNATIQVFDGSTSLGTTTASSAGVWSLMLASPLGIGSHSLTAAQTVSGPPSAASSALVVSVTTLAPSGVKTDAALASPLSALSVPAFAATTGRTGAKEILVDSGTTYQTMVGFGAAITDSAAYVLSTYLSSSALSTLLNEVYVTNGFNMNRYQIGDSDYTVRAPNATIGGTQKAAGFKTYDDADPAGTLTSFSMANDDVNMTPVVTKVLAVRPDLITLGSPWSPPAVYKNGNPGTLTGGTQYFVDTAANFTAYASYLADWATGFKSRFGKFPDYLTIQNEGNFNPGATLGVSGPALT